MILLKELFTKKFSWLAHLQFLNFILNSNLIDNCLVLISYLFNFINLNKYLQYRVIDIKFKLKFRQRSKVKYFTK